MSKQRSQRLRRSSEEELASSQSSQQSQLPSQVMQDHVNNCIIKILANNFALHPYPRSELLSNAKVRGRAAKQLIEEVKTKLFNIYGLTLVENGNKFTLINPKDKVLDQFRPSNTITSTQIFLGLLLTIIVHNNDQISADELRLFFAELSVDIDKNDTYFGNVKKMLQELEQQQYLEKITIPVPSQPSQIIYKWGLRSSHEVNKKDLIPVIAMMYGMPAEELPPPLISLYTADD